MQEGIVRTLETDKYHSDVASRIATDMHDGGEGYVCMCVYANRMQILFCNS